MTRTVSAKPVDPITADLGTIVGRAARRFGSKPALIAGERIITYEELDHLCERTAAGLLDLGVAPGDRVSLYSPNRWEWVVAYHAVLRVGAVVNPINVMLTAEEVGSSSTTAERRPLSRLQTRPRRSLVSPPIWPTAQRDQLRCGAGWGCNLSRACSTRMSACRHYSGPDRRKCPLSATPRAPLVTPRAPCSRTELCSSTRLPSSRPRPGPSTT